MVADLFRTAYRGRPKKHGEGHSKNSWDGFIWRGTRRRTWLQTDHTGDKLLSNVLCSTGGTKSK